MCDWFDMIITEYAKYFGMEFLFGKIDDEFDILIKNLCFEPLQVAEFEHDVDVLECKEDTKLKFLEFSSHQCCELLKMEQTYRFQDVWQQVSRNYDFNSLKTFL